MSARSLMLTLALLAMLAPLGLAPASAAPATQPQPALNDVPVARTLNGPLLPRGGTVRAASAVGDIVAYIADFDLEGRSDLYAITAPGGGPVRLTAGLPEGRVESFRISPTGHVVFSYRPFLRFRYLLYSVPATGGPPIQLNTDYPTPAEPLQAGGTYMEFLLTAAGDRVVYRVDHLESGLYDLFSVPVGGGSPVQLSPAAPQRPYAITVPRWVRNFFLSADGRLVAFDVNEQPFGGKISLYAAPTSGGSPVKLNVSNDPGSFEGFFRVAPDGSRVLYTLRDTGSSSLSHLISVAPDGSGSVRLDSGSLRNIKIGGGTGRAVYQLGSELRSIPLAGGSSTLLATNAGSYALGSFQISPDGSRVFFNTGSDGALASAPVLGGPTTVVLDAPAVNLENFGFSADGTRAIFLAGSLMQATLFSAPLDGPATRIGDPAQIAGGTGRFVIAPTGDRIAFVARATVDGPLIAYSSTISGGDLIQLSEPSPILRIAAIAGTQAIIMSGTELDGNRNPIHSAILTANIAAPLSAAPLDRPRSVVGDVQDFAVSRASGRVVYRANQEVRNRSELYSVPVAGGAPIKLNGPGQRVLGFAVSPDGALVAFHAESPAGASETGLYTVPIGGGAVTAIGDPLAWSAFPATLRFSPDGTRLFFWPGVESPTSTTPRPLSSVPVAGGPAQLIGADVRRFAFDPTGARVLFREGGGSISDPLISAPIAGGQRAGLGPALSDTPVLISPDGALVVYLRGGHLMPTVLVSQPLAGGTATPLLDTDAANLGVSTFQLSADGAFVIVAGVRKRNDESQPLVLRLLRIPITGGEAVTLVERSFPATSTAHVTSLAIAHPSIGGAVVYSIKEWLTNQDQVRYSLGSVPLAGGPEVRLWNPSAPERAPLAFTVSGDGRSVLFVADQQLYRVPSTGGTPEALGGQWYMFPEFRFAEDGAALFLQGGIYRAAPGEPAVRVDGLPEGTYPDQLPAELDGTLVFTGLTNDSIYSSTGGSIPIRELYAAGIGQSFTVHLPMLLRR